MKRRFGEVLGIVGLVAVVMLSLQHRETKESVPLTSWSVAIPSILPASPEPCGQPAAFSALEPNLTRDPNRFNARSTMVDSITLGMCFTQVAQKLGQAQSINGNPPYRFEARFPGIGPFDTFVGFAGDRVVSIGGNALLVGNRYCTSGQSVADLTDLLGKIDHLHHYGYGGIPVYCWAGKDLVLEVTDFEGKLGMLRLADPAYFHNSPHLWWLQ